MVSMMRVVKCVFVYPAKEESLDVLNAAPVHGIHGLVLFRGASYRQVGAGD